MPLDFSQDRPESAPDFNAGHRASKDDNYANLAGPNGDFSVPTIQEIGIKKPTTPHRGGETKALAALSKIIENEKYTATFEKPKTAPTAFDPQSTTLLSPHLHFGSLSCREFYWRVSDTIENFKGAPSAPPTNLIGQLLFRDMYFGAQAKLGAKFSQTVGNQQVRFIPWHLRSVVDEKTGLATGKYAVDSTEAEEWFERWKTARTGFPWIDAIMRQLKQEGWIHHLARHAVACFLTRGGCYIDWERGAEVFEEWLLDHEVACNAGNWQWLSCTAFFAQFYRCYSPISFPQKTDKNGDFVRRYVPELKDFPAKYIYEPWKAPIADQKKAGCRIQGDGTQEIDGMRTYPKPMFDFSERRQICIDGMKNAYDIHMYGNDKKLLDGTWPSAFADSAEGPTKGNSVKDQKVLEEKDEGDIESDYGSEADDGHPRGHKPSPKKDAKRKRQGTLDSHMSPRKAKK